MKMADLTKKERQWIQNISQILIDHNLEISDGGIKKASQIYEKQLLKLSKDEKFIGAAAKLTFCKLRLV